MNNRTHDCISYGDLCRLSSEIRLQVVQQLGRRVMGISDAEIDNALSMPNPRYEIFLIYRNRTAATKHDMFRLLHTAAVVEHLPVSPAAFRCIGFNPPGEG